MSACNDQSVNARDLHLLVYSYLLHTNCARTASAFARTCGLATSGSLTSPTAPAYLSEPFSSSTTTAIATTAPSEQTKKSKGKASANDDDNNNESNSAAASRYSSCVSIAEAHATTAAATTTTTTTMMTAGDDDADARASGLIAHHIEYLRIRQSICASIEAREPEVALDLLSTYFRSVLIPPPSDHLTLSPLPLRQEFNATLLRFRLDIQYYVELISKHKELEALQFGQRTLWRYTDIFDTWLNHSISLSSSTAGESLRLHYSATTATTAMSPPPLHPHSSSASLSESLSPVVAADGDDDGEVVSRLELKHKRAEIMRHITNVAALVAYPDPSQSPLAYLLTQERREELAATVNAAILKTMSFPREPALVTLVRQLATTSAYLVGYRSARSSTTITKKDEQQQSTASASASAAAVARQQPWLLDTFVNSDEAGADTFA
ncbi:hypothetical protein GGF44_000113 [Coemansia sp. RSA 1694]|nr:hypothetical protein GGF44_000113 [Coemansia sp. RSA 1694]